jgi:hypothetical protein
MQWGYHVDDINEVGHNLAKRIAGTVGLTATVTSFSLITDRIYQNSDTTKRTASSLATAVLGTGAFALSHQEGLTPTMKKALSLTSAALESHSVLSTFSPVADLLSRIGAGITNSCCRRTGITPPRKEQLEAAVETILGTVAIAAFNTLVEEANKEETEIIERFFTRFCGTIALMMAVPAYDKFARTIMHSENAAKGFVWGAITAIGGALLSQAANHAESEAIETTLQAIAVAAETETVHALFPTARSMWRTIAKESLNRENYGTALRGFTNIIPFVMPHPIAALPQIQLDTSPLPKTTMEVERTDEDMTRNPLADSPGGGAGGHITAITTRATASSTGRV